MRQTNRQMKPRKLKVGDSIQVDWVTRMGIGQSGDFATVTELESKHPHWTPGKHTAVVNRTNDKISVVWDEDRKTYIGLQF